MLDKIYIIICFFFFADIIELIFYFFVGYKFGYFVYAAFRKKNNRKKDIVDFFKNYKQRMTEKPTIEIQLEKLTLENQEKLQTETTLNEPSFYNKNFLIVKSLLTFIQNLLV